MCVDYNYTLGTAIFIMFRGMRMYINQLQIHVLAGLRVKTFIAAALLKGLQEQTEDIPAMVIGLVAFTPAFRHLPLMLWLALRKD